MITITTAEFKENVNLDKLKKDELINSHMFAVDLKLQGITQPDVYESVNEETADEPVVKAFKLAFSYLLYMEILPFLNVNTAGSGIVSSTGIDQSRTELISQTELERRQNSAELKAYELLYTYLNDAGKNRLGKLKYYEDLHRLDVSDIEQKTAILEQKNNNRRTRVGIV